MLLSGLDDGKILYTTVFENIMRAGNWKCVISGCAVSPSSGMNVSVGSGSILFDDSLVSVSGTILNVGNSLQDRDRIVVIVYDGSDGQLKVLTRNEWLQIGDNYYPLTPRLTSNQVALAIVRIPRGASGITANDITDVRSMFNVGADINAFKRILKAINRETNVGAIISALQNENDDVASMVLMNLQDGVLASVLNSSSITDTKALAWAGRLCDRDMFKLVNVLAHANIGSYRVNTILYGLWGKIFHFTNPYLFHETIYATFAKVTDTTLRNAIVTFYDGLDYSNISFERIINCVTYGASNVTYSSNTSINFVIANNVTVNSGVTVTLADAGAIIARNVYNSGTIKGNSGFYLFANGNVTGGVFESGHEPIGQMIRFSSSDRCGNGGNGAGISSSCCNTGNTAGGQGGNPGGGGGGATSTDNRCSVGGTGATVSFTLWSISELKRRLMMMMFYRLGWSGILYQFPSIGSAEGGGGNAGGRSGGELIIVGRDVSGTYNAYGLNGSDGWQYTSCGGVVYRGAPAGGGGGGLVYVIRFIGSPSINVSGGSAGSMGSFPSGCLYGSASNGSNGMAVIYGWL